MRPADEHSGHGSVRDRLSAAVRTSEESNEPAPPARDPEQLDSIASPATADGTAQSSVRTELTVDDVSTVLTELGAAVVSDGDDVLVGRWPGGYVSFIVTNENLLTVYGEWEYSMPQDRHADVMTFTNTWNGDRVWPKAFTRLGEGGSVEVCGEVTADLRLGFTAAHLEDIVVRGVGELIDLFDAVRAAFDSPRQPGE